MIGNSIKILIGVNVALFSLLAHADPIAVTYEIGSYNNGGYSGSWVHEASGCEGEGPSGQILYMCGNAYEAQGSLIGSMNEGVLTISDGVLIVEGEEFDILSGSLGGLGDWFIDIQDLGTFYFEDLGMGDGMPNEFSLDQVVLWGQNALAYACNPQDDCDGYRFGIDLYASRASVPEPGTLALLGLGLLGMGAARKFEARRA